GGRVQAVIVTAQDRGLLGARGNPDARGLVVRGGDDVRAVGIEGDRVYAALMPVQRPDLGPGCWVPDSGRVIAPGDDQFSIGAVGSSVHMLPIEDVDLPPRDGVPDSRGAVQ